MTSPGGLAAWSVEHGERMAFDTNALSRPMGTPLHSIDTAHARFYSGRR